MYIVSAASSNHFKSACQFIHSVPKEFHIIFYDIGLSDKEYNEISLKFPHITIRKFDFSKYPEHVSLSSPDAGAYAWKPIIISEVYSQITEGVLLWCDSGNLLNSQIYNLEVIIQQNKIYTSTTQGNISELTHPNSLQNMNISETISKMRMRNAACIGFLCGDSIVKSFIDEWKRMALIKDVILPSGANRTNHRHDQSILSCLYYMYNIPNMDSYIGYSIHKDID